MCVLFCRKKGQHYYIGQFTQVIWFILTTLLVILTFPFFNWIQSNETEFLPLSISSQWNSGFESLAKHLVLDGNYNTNEIIYPQNGTTLLHYAVTRMCGFKLIDVEISVECSEYFLCSAGKGLKARPIVQLLLDNGANVNAEDVYQRTPIYYTTGSSDIARLLIEHHADINRTDRYGKSPLHVAAENGEVYVVNELIRSKANLNHTTPLGETALHILAKTSSIQKIYLNSV